jgi:hypothetical protein
VSDRGLRVSSVVFALVLGAACSSSGSNAKAPPDASSTTIVSVGGTTAPGTGTTTGSSTTPSSSTFGNHGDPTVAALLLTDVPSGFARQPDSVADTGPTNLTKAIQDEVAANAAQVLRQTGFVSGYQRAWADAGQVRQDIIFLYRFATAAGAAQYANNRAAEVRFQSVGAINAFAVFLPSGIGLHSETPESSFAAVTFSKGVYAVEALSTNGVKEDQSPAAAALANAQFQRLP